ncbi:hypothetical protein J0J26_20535 [Vibrio vulnificus]|uniref:hypothetical protein n=1 Tax=Vibrio vulnificus TaxID=672 RepID=UPI0019D483C8|nr:hypothetical protein [Vibrio vulnificus]MBN8090494.1 hypothetical protein [Vibrio vulnificus]MBN8119321.1 hypothetical protein [Vibrio vulnificus]
MIDIYLDVEDERWLDKKFIAEKASAALKVTQKWLTNESVKRLGKELRIRASSSRRRIKSAKIKGNKTSVWFGILPLNLAYIRDYSQVPKGVLSGDAFYKGAFVQSMKNSPLLIWQRTRDRKPQPKPRQKPLPKGQRRERKSPQVAVVREEFHHDAEGIIAQLETEIQDVYKEAFLNELHQ